MQGPFGGHGRELRRLTALVRGSGATEIQDVRATLEQLCRVATCELDLSGAAVTLISPDGAGMPGTETVAATSDPLSQRLEDLQLSVGEGPGRDAFTTGRPVLTSDLKSASRRWPGYVSGACELGVAAVFAFPLQIGSVRLGTLTFQGSRSVFLADAQVFICLVFVDLAVEVLLAPTVTSPPGDPNPGLLRTLDYRDQVYQAQGMVMVELGVSLLDAMARMRAHAFATNLDVSALAADIVAGAVQLPDDRERR